MAFTGELGHLTIESPFANAGGVVKTIEDVEKIALTGVGWIEAGSYTLEDRLGNAYNPYTTQFDNRVYNHNEQTGVTVNSLGMPNIGFITDGEAETLQEQLPGMLKAAHKQHKPLVVNVAPVSSSPVEESQDLVVAAFESGADGVLLNGGCPNVVEADGGRHELLSRDPDMLYKVLHGLRHITAKYNEVFLRVSPLREQRTIESIAKAVKCSAAVSAVFTPNTWPGYRSVDENGEGVLDVPGGVGGASGPAYANKALVETSLWVQELRGSGIDTVLSSGVMDADTMRRGLSLGAVAACGTTFFYESTRGWPQDVDDLLSDFARTA